MQNLKKSSSFCFVKNLNATIFPKAIFIVNNHSALKQFANKQAVTLFYFFNYTILIFFSFFPREN